MINQGKTPIQVEVLADVEAQVMVFGSAMKSRFQRTIQVSVPPGQGLAQQSRQINQKVKAQLPQGSIITNILIQ